jgi:hypothetical protein
MKNSDLMLTLAADLLLEAGPLRLLSVNTVAEELFKHGLTLAAVKEDGRIQYVFKFLCEGLARRMEEYATSEIPKGEPVEGEEKEEFLQSLEEEGELPADFDPSVHDFRAVKLSLEELAAYVKEAAKEAVSTVLSSDKPTSGRSPVDPLMN